MQENLLLLTKSIKQFTSNQVKNYLIPGSIKN